MIIHMGFLEGTWETVGVLVGKNIPTMTSRETNVVRCFFCAANRTTMVVVGQWWSTKTIGLLFCQFIVPLAPGGGIPGWAKTFFMIITWKIWSHKLMANKCVLNLLKPPHSINLAQFSWSWPSTFIDWGLDWVYHNVFHFYNQWTKTS